MSRNAVRLLVLHTLVPLACVVAISRTANADDFGPSHYDRATNELVVTIVYDGTNPNHEFTLKWGACEFDESGRRKPLVNADLLDDQFNDAAQQQYKIVRRFSLDDMPCPRPAIVTFSIAPNASFELVIPK